jgi:hypothetical protein
MSASGPACGERRLRRGKSWEVETVIAPPCCTQKQFCSWLYSTFESGVVERCGPVIVKTKIFARWLFCVPQGPGRLFSFAAAIDRSHGVDGIVG